MDKSLDIRDTMRRPGADDRSVGNDRTMQPSSSGQPGRRFRAGDVILARYRVTDELGQGGMGVVYRCFDEVAGIDVALKALPPEVAHNSGEMEEVRENFRLVSKLHHPNIANINTLERDAASGDYYLVMECVDGLDLRQWARRRRSEGRSLTLDEVTVLAHRIASALDYAHGQKVIHRDIKPSNVRVNFEGDVKVLDFGLAAQLHTSMSRVSRAYGGTSGTGPYMAPEQWMGRRQGAAADQYALAASVYELLCGVPPFENHDTAILREAVLKQDILPLENVPPHVNAALLRGLSKEPAARFESCGAFVQALAGEGDAGGKRSDPGVRKQPLEDRRRTAEGASSVRAGVWGKKAAALLAAAVAAAALCAVTWNVREARSPQPLPAAPAEAVRVAAVPPAESPKAAEKSAGGAGAAVVPPPARPAPVEKPVRSAPPAQPAATAAAFKPAAVATKPFADLAPEEAAVAITFDQLQEGSAQAYDRQRESSEKLSVPVRVRTRISQLPLRLLPPGTFEMGSESREPGHSENESLHQVILSMPVYVGSREVSVADWLRVMEEKPSSSLVGMAELPKCDVSWDEAVQFCSRLSRLEGVAGNTYRLLTEAEWECACRAGVASAFVTGKIQTLAGRSSRLELVGWYDQNSKGSPQKVGQLLPNAWGLYDMHGNAMEWCMDSAEKFSNGEIVVDTYRSGIQDPVCRAGSYRIARGGSWFRSAEHCRSAKRSAYLPTERSPFLGFRVCRVVSAWEVDQNKKGEKK